MNPSKIGVKIRQHKALPQNLEEQKRPKNDVGKHFLKEYKNMEDDEKKPKTNAKSQQKSLIVQAMQKPTPRTTFDPNMIPK